MPRPPSGLDADARLRHELVALLRGGQASADAGAILGGLPPERINERAGGHALTLWELAYHLWFTQHDILIFAVNPAYEAPAWPDAYWPAAEGTPEAWADTTRAFLDDREKLVRLVESAATDLAAELDHAPGYTLLREVLLAAEHNAHHLGQVVALRRAMGLWGG